MTLAQKQLHRFGDPRMELARQVAKRVLHTSKMLVVTLEIKLHHALNQLTSHVRNIALAARSRAKFCVHIEGCAFETFSKRLLLLTLEIRRKRRKSVCDFGFVRVSFDDDVPSSQPGLIFVANFGKKVRALLDARHALCTLDLGWRSFRIQIAGQICHWLATAGLAVRSSGVVNLVPMFCPDLMAKICRQAEPVVERIPLLRDIACGQSIIVAGR